MVAKLQPRKIPLVSFNQLRDEVRKNPNVPLVVDLDRTLVVVDVFQAQLAYLLVRKPWQLLTATRQYFSGGLPVLKEWVNSRSGLTSGDLKLNPGVVDLIETASGREIELCTGACESVAIEVSERVSGITSVSSSGGGQNLTGRSKATYLLSKYGAKGFFTSEIPGKTYMLVNMPPPFLLFKDRIAPIVGLRLIPERFGRRSPARRE